MTILTPLRRRFHLRRCLLLLALLVVPLPARGSLGSLNLRAAPEVVRADGQSRTTITAEVRDSDGSLAPDGTLVHFTTTAGQIENVAPTTAGRARAAFTSDAIPGVAQVSAFSGSSSATIIVRMVEDPEAIGPSARVIDLDGRYVAYSESLGILESIGEARLVWKRRTITAEMIQADLTHSVIRARGKVRIESKRGQRPAAPPAAPPPAPVALPSGAEPAGETPSTKPPCCDLGPDVPHLHGDYLALDMMSDQATLVTGETWQTIDVPSLTPLPKAAKGPDPLEWKELQDSDMLWKADRILAVPGQKVQLRKTEAFVGGQRVVRLPYHEISLAEGVSTQGQQYVGVGSNGLAIDLPYFLQMNPGASTSLRLRHGARSGFGWYGTNPGWQLDLERRYGLPGATEGTLSLGRITDGDWGVFWNHSQRLAKGTQAYAMVEYPSHKDLFSNLNLSRQGRQGSLGLNLSAHKLQDRTLGRTFDANAQTAPRQLGQTGVRLTLESRLYDSRGGDFVAFDGKRYEVAPSYSRELGLRLTPAFMKIGRGGLGSWVSLKHVWGSQNRTGIGMAGAVAFSQPMGRGGGLTLNYTYNRFPGNTFYGTAGRQNLSGSLRLNPARRLFLGAFGTMGLDSSNRSFSTSAAYSFGPVWRLELQQTAYQFRTLQEHDLQFGLTRAIGNREVTFYWSRLRHRLMFEITGGAF
jgi:hypothetical protein